MRKNVEMFSAVTDNFDLLVILQQLRNGTLFLPALEPYQDCIFLSKLKVYNILLRFP